MSISKMTFSLASLILILAFAAMPAMAGTLSSAWSTDADGPGSGTDAGWLVTLTLPYTGDTAPTAPTPTNIVSGSVTDAGIFANIDETGLTSAALTPVTTPAPPDKTKRWTFAVVNPANSRILVQIPGYQRVIFPVSAPGAVLLETNLVYTAKIESAVMKVYIKANAVKDIVFTFAAANAKTKIGAPQNLHISDVVRGGSDPDGSTTASVSGKNTVRVQSSSSDDGASATYTLSPRIAQTGGNITTVTFDGTAPSYPASAPDEDGETTIPVDRRKPAAPDQWGAVPFDYIFTIVEQHSGIQSVTLSDNQDLLDFTGIAPTGETTANVNNSTQYAAEVSTQNKDITAGTVTTIFAIVTDKAGNEAELNIGSVTLAAKTMTATDATLPTTAITPASGAEVSQGGTVTLAFDKDPGMVTVAPTGAATISTSGATRTLTISRTQAPGAVSIKLTWGSAGSLTLAYTVISDSAQRETSSVTVPPESYVIVARTAKGAIDGLANVNLPANTSNVAGSMDPSIHIWASMPNLEALLFGGGTIALTVTKAADTVLFDHDADGAALSTGKKADGTDGTKPRQYAARDLIITEVMAAKNTAKTGTDKEISHQWIEIYNPNKRAITGTLGTQKGRPPLEAKSTEVLLDRLSNVVGGGWALAGLGQNGFDDDVGSGPNFAAGKANVDFVSFYRSERGKEGHTKGHWKSSEDYYYAGHKGTPGAGERAGVKVLTATSIPRSPVIFNEIANRGSGNTAYEWIELRNVSDGEANLKNWQISIVTAVNSDKEFFNFYDKDIKVPAGGVLLLVTSDPSDNPDHPLAAGFNIEKGADNQARGVNANSPRYLIMKKSAKDDNDQRGLKSTYADGEGLPNNGEFVLILRNGLDKEGKAEKLIDIAGYDTNLSVDSATDFTGLWPLVNYPKPDVPLNKLEANKVHRRQHAGIDGTRTTDKKDNADHGAFRDVGWTGIGYKRGATPSAALGGTPGYSNGALKSEGADAQNPVIISEIMFDNSRNFTQWIELHNTSKMHGMDINNWSIFIVNHNDNADGSEYTGKLTERIDLDGKIPPGQTYLIVSRRGTSNTKLPAARIHSANKKRSETMLNPHGFQITLKAKTNEGDANKHQTVDMVGNLGAVPANSRRADAQSFEKLAWTLPASKNDSGARVSINRRFTKGKLSDAASAGRIDGTDKRAWVPFDMSEQISLGNYYGHESDIGSPGYTTGGVLPVSLSKFRPERLDTGEIVIRWITESELNNAGFNILRSEKRDGQFTKINTSLIAGQGTTSERTSYSMVDKSAKPNVVYYYQIQDVSLDGQVQTLRQSRLKGDVSPAGKLTTQWAEIKALQ